jgi:hypothetical protein
MMCVISGIYNIKNKSYIKDYNSQYTTEVNPRIWVRMPYFII